MPNLKYENTIAELQAVPRPLDGEVRWVSGYWQPDDGGGGWFRFDRSDTTPADDGLVFLPIARRGRWRRIIEHPGMASVKWWGARGNGLDSDSGAFRRAIEAMDPGPDIEFKLGFGTRNAYGWRLLVPSSPTPYLLDEDLIINRSMILEGVTGMSFGSSVLYFESGGIVVQSPKNNVYERPRGSFATIRELLVRSNLKNHKHGVWVKTNCRLERLRIVKFGGHGIFIDGQSKEEPDPEHRNANNTRVIDVGSDNNDGWGLYVRGADSNACLFSAVNVTGNRLGGIFDSSTFGNIHIGHHAEGNGGFIDDGTKADGTLNIWEKDPPVPETDPKGKLAYKSGREARSERDGSNHRSLWLRVYSEEVAVKKGVLGRSEIEHPAMIISGTHGHPIEPSRTNAQALYIRDAFLVTPFIVKSRWRTVNEDDESKETKWGIDVALGLPRGNGILRWHMREHPVDVRDPDKGEIHHRTSGNLMYDIDGERVVLTRDNSRQNPKNIVLWFEDDQEKYEYPEVYIQHGIRGPGTTKP